MSEILNSCGACENMDPSDCLSEEVVREELEKHPLWTLNDNGQLSRKFEAKNFVLAMEFLQQVGIAAERAGHHPDLHLTEYRRVELVLYTHSVNGVTKEDIKMLDVLDDIPVVYSAHWKKTHHDALSAATPSPAPHPTQHSNDHHPARGIVGVGSGTSSLVHSSSMSDDGTQLHQKEFRVHTGHSVPLGHSDAPHHQLHSTVGSDGTLYETETQRLEETVLRGTVSHAQFGQQLRGTVDSSEAGGKIPPSRAIPRETWMRMANALRTLQSSGFDTGEAGAYLNMFDSRTIHPTMEVEVFRFYKHMLHRLEPEWRKTEPVAVVEAALQFVEGYESLKGISVLYEDKKS